MTKNTIIVLCALFTGLAVCSTPTVRAQQVTWVERPTQDARGYVIKEPAGRMSDFFMSQPLESKVVKGAPYSAEVVTESIQPLADGNRIVQRSTSRVYRDVEGRVRREDDRPAGSPSISITDPVAHTSTTLDPANRTARETPNVMDLYIEAVQSLSNEVRRVTVNPEPATSGAVVRGRSGGSSEVPTPASAGSVTAGGRGGRGAGGAPRAVRRDQVEEQLPSRVIEGVLATGVRRTTTIPKDAIGNEQPIKIVSEEWTSPDLQVLVLTDVNDPRTGHSTYKLQRIVRVDPDPSLFKVPADYTVQRAGGRGRGGLE